LSRPNANNLSATKNGSLRSSTPLSVTRPCFGVPAAKTRSRRRSARNNPSRPAPDAFRKSRREKPKVILKSLLYISRHRPRDILTSGIIELPAEENHIECISQDHEKGRR